MTLDFERVVAVISTLGDYVRRHSYPYMWTGSVIDYKNHKCREKQMELAMKWGIIQPILKKEQ
jgi:hypothetical protein